MPAESLTSPELRCCASVPSRRTVFLASVVVASFLTGCSDGGPTEETPRSSTADASEVWEAKVETSGVEVSGTVDGVRVTASAPGDVAEEGTVMALSPSNAPEAEIPVAVASLKSFSLVLGQERQPHAPITLTIDLSEEPQFYEQISDTVFPVIAVDTDNPEIRDLLRVDWDPATKTATATTNHLSDFRVTLVDAGKALSDAVKSVTAQMGALPQAGAASEEAGTSPRGGAPRSSCSKEDLVIGATTYTLISPARGEVEACLRAQDENAQLQFTSRSSQYFTVTSQPAARFENGSMPLPSTEQVTVWLFQQGQGKAGVLTPEGSGTLTIPTDVTTTVRLDADPSALQIKTVLKGMEMLGVEGDELVTLFQAGTAGYDCLVTGHKSVTRPVKEPPEEFTRALTDIAQCAWSVGEMAIEDTKSRLLHRMGVAGTLILDLPNQFVANVTGALGEFSGDNHLEFTVRVETEAPEVTSASSTPNGESNLELATMITSNGFGFTRGQNLYALSNTHKDGGRYYADINFHWRLNRGEGSDLGYCRPHVQITTSDGRPVADYELDTFNACQGGGAFATNTKIFDPGDYQVIADIETQRGGTYHATQMFTVIDD